MVDFAEFDYTEPASEKVQGAGAGEPRTDSLDRAAPDEHALASNANALTLSQVSRAASLPATQQTDEQTLTAAVLPSGDGIEITSQILFSTPTGQAAGGNEARGPPAGTGDALTLDLYSIYDSFD